MPLLAEEAVPDADRQRGRRQAPRIAEGHAADVEILARCEMPDTFDVA